MVAFVMAASLLCTPIAAQADGGIGYPSVQAALEALRARSDADISVQGGWTIVNERATGALWSFTPSAHPAHPAAVKRTVVERDGKVFIEMGALCQASKTACDKLMSEFQELNEKIARESRNSPARDGGPASDIQVRRLSDDMYRVVLKTSRSSTVEAGQQEMLPKAREICAGRAVQYGKFRFESTRPLEATAVNPGVLILDQEIHCGAPKGDLAARVDDRWFPTSDTEQSIKLQTLAYFSAKDEAKYQEAYSLFSESQKQTVSFESWRSAAEDFNSRAGSAKSRRIRKITWYKDPPGTQPGVYAAVDFAGQFANVDLHCGYVVWRREPDGNFRLVREEVSFIEKAVQQKMKPEQLEQVRAQFRC